MFLVESQALALKTKKEEEAEAKKAAKIAVRPAPKTVVSCL